MSVADKVRKLLALAEDQQGLPEGEVAASMARKLLQEHNLTKADIDLDESTVIEEVVEIVKRQQWRRGLFDVLAKYCGVFSLYTTQSRKVTLYGERASVEVTKFLYSVVLRRLEGEAAEHIAALKASGEWMRSSPRRRRTERNSFLNSAVYALTERLETQTEMESSANDEGAIVLLEQLEAARDFAAEKTSWRSNSGSTFRFSAEGYSAGERVELQDGVQGRGRATLALE